MSSDSRETAVGSKGAAQPKRKTPYPSLLNYFEIKRKKAPELGEGEGSVDVGEGSQSGEGLQGEGEGSQRKGASATSVSSSMSVEGNADSLVVAEAEDVPCVAAGPSLSGSAARPPAKEPLSSQRPSQPESGNRQENDIGKYAGASVQPASLVVAALLEDHWDPPQGYEFPHSVHRKSGGEQRRFLRREHLEKYPWLVLSREKRGLFCKCCALFAVRQTSGRHGNTPRTLVTEPLLKFSKLLGKDGDLEAHSRTEYHQTAMLKAEQFLQIFHNSSNSVANRLDSSRIQRAQDNKDRLLSALKNVLFLGRQNIAFRGHRDDGRIDLERKDFTNQGNFKELLYFRVECGDEKLERQIRTAAVRNQFTSKTTQNALIECCGDEILSVILERVRQSDFYSIGFDETTDISHQSQLSIFVRYLYEKNVREDFLCFINPRKVSKKGGNPEAEDSEVEPEDEETELAGGRLAVSEEEVKLTGQRIAEVVLDTITDMHLDAEVWVGIATDGCSVMTSEIRGAVAEIKKKAPNAERSPCFSHALNLSISKSTTVQPVRNAVGIIKEVVAFSDASPKRNAVFRTFLQGQLSGLCETRFVERHDGVVNFVSDIEKIVDALESISEWNGGTDSTSAAKAKSLLTAITHGEFIISVICLGDVLGTTRSLSICLQAEALDLESASNFYRDTIAVLARKREMAEQEFADLFKKAEEIAKKLGSEIKLPRLKGRQTHRGNVGVPATAEGEITAETYFRLNLFIPLLENVVEDLKNRIQPEVLNAFRLNTFLPHRCLSQGEEKTAEDLQVLSKKYARLLRLEENVLHSRLKSEHKLWVAKWTRERSCGATLPKTAVEAIDSCSVNFYPTVLKMLSILAVLPVSICTSERSFSTLRCVKTYLRNRCGQLRLNGLALMYIHRDIPIDNDKVIARYTAQGGKFRKGCFSA